MVGCVVFGCKSRSERKIAGITFHSFPSNMATRAKWLDATGRQNWQPTKYSKICSIHFDNDSLIYKEKRVELKPYSIPLKNVHVGIPKSGSAICSHDDIKLHPSTSRQADTTVDSSTSQGTVCSYDGILCTHPSTKRHSDIVGRVTLSSTAEGQGIRYEIPESRELILRVYRYLREEYEQLKELTENNFDLSAIKNSLKRTSLATGVNKSIIAAILLEEKLTSDDDEVSDEGPAKRQKLDESDDDVRQNEHDREQDSGTEVKQDEDECVLRMEIKYEDDNYLIADDSSLRNVVQ